MPRPSIPFSFPEFRGATRRLVLTNLATFFVLLLIGFASSHAAGVISGLGTFDAMAFLRGWIWQPLTYSFMHYGILNTALELLSLFFLAGFLERGLGANWVTGLYIAAVLGTAFTAAGIFVVTDSLNHPLAPTPLYGCMGGIFGLLIAIGVLYGDVEFMLMFVIGIKAKYMAAIYALITLAMLFGQQSYYAFAQLGGAAAGLLYLKFMPRRGFNFIFSESLYGLRNRYYRWKRRRAARKFEVYMRKQGRTVRYDGQGHPIDENPDDRKRWN
jgi:membrane associated rhomboid family serine protease